MSYDEGLADRIRKAFQSRQVTFEEKKMMGGLCFMVNGKMCVGVEEEKLMVRLDPEIYHDALTRPGCREMNFTGRPMRGFVFVELEGVKGTLALQEWIGLALEFNPRAKSSKKK